MEKKIDDRRKAELDVDVTRWNESHASSDFHYAIQISVRLLKPIGAWPLAERETSRLIIILRRILITIVIFLLIFGVAPWISYGIKERWGIALIMRAFCPLLFTNTVIARYLLLLYHEKRLRSCMDRVADDWRRTTIADDREIMLEHARLGRTFGIVSVTFMFTCGIMFYLMPLIIPSPSREDNITVRLHPVPCELFVLDVQISPTYEIVYFLQILAGYLTYSAFCGICSLMANFVMHVCAQCNLLTVVFEETVDGGEHNSGTMDMRIATAMNRHLRLLKLTSDVTGLFTEICLLEFINASCNICLLGYFIITDLNNNESFLQISMYFFALVSIIFNVFIICYIGDLLTDHCQKMGTACYFIEWYRMPPRKAIELIMPIMMSRHLVILSAGKMIAMSLSTFSDILKTSMAYFNLLREFSSRDVTRM